MGDGIKFETLNSDLAETLKRNNVFENDLFHHYGDLYVGCRNTVQAKNIKEAGPWRSMSSLFTPQKESSMDSYPVGIDIGLAAMQHDFNKRFANRIKAKKNE